MPTRLSNSTTPELLRLFTLTAEHGSIAAAARVLDLAPSLATRKIAQLESALGVRLFERTTRSSKLTEAGSIALQWAIASLDAQAKVMDDLSAVQGDPSGLIRMVVSQSSASALLPEVLAKFNELYPRIRIAISSNDALINLVNGHFDIAIHSGRIPDSSLVGQRIHQFQRVLCATPAYLARFGVPSRLADLGEHQCLSHSVNEPRNWFFRKEHKMFCQPIVPAFEADAYTVLLELARSSLGIARLAQPLVQQDLDAGRLIQLMSDHTCVYPDGELPGLWVLYPGRRVLHRTRLLIDFVIANLELNFR